MSAARPPSPPDETLDDPDLIIDQTAPPQRSPLKGAPLPFGPPRPGAPAAPGPPRPGAPAPPRPPPKTPVPFGDETAAPQRSPLAAALPFRHAKPSAPEPTMAIPALTPEDIARMTAGGPAPAAATHAQGAPDRARIERAKLEQARTVAFAMPPEPQAPPPGAPPVPRGGGPVAAKSTGHFGLSIEQYAALCAELAVFPERVEAIFTQYGLGQRKDRMTADLAWQERLRADNALMAKWQSLYLYYHEYYAQLKHR